MYMIIYKQKVQKLPRFLELWSSGYLYLFRNSLGIRHVVLPNRRNIMNRIDNRRKFHHISLARIQKLEKTFFLFILFLFQQSFGFLFNSPPNLVTKSILHVAKFPTTRKMKTITKRQYQSDLLMQFYSFFVTTCTSRCSCLKSISTYVK